MNKFVAIVYPDQDTAGEVYELLQRMQSEELIDVHDAAYATKDAKGKLKLHEVSHATGEGALAGGAWGMLIGLLFFAPMLGLLLGAGVGALAGHSEDFGLGDDFMKDLANKMKPDNSAIFILASDVVTDKVLPQLSEYGGEILQTSLSKETDAKLQKALDQDTKTQSTLNA